MDKGRVEMWMIGRMDTGVFFSGLRKCLLFSR